MSEELQEVPSLECLRRLRQGDVNAFEEVAVRYERPLRAWLATMTMPGIDGDDIAQRSLIIAFKKIHEFVPGSNFGAWLFSIARWQLKTEETRLRRLADYRSRYAPDILLKLHGDGEVEPDHLMDKLENLRRCVRELSQELSCFMRWRYYDEISLEEMAKLSERSVPAVKKQLWKLRLRLRQCLEKRMAGNPSF